MAQQGDLGFNAATRRKPAQPVSGQHPVARYDDRDRIAAAGLADGLGRGVEVAGEIAVGSCFSEGNSQHQRADPALQVGAMDGEGEVEMLAVPGEIGVDLGLRLGEQR